MLETPTWRASADWGARLGYDAAALTRVNRDAVEFLRTLGGAFEAVEVTVSGNVGPRGDGYDPDELLSPTWPRPTTGHRWTPSSPLVPTE